MKAIFATGDFKTLEDTIEYVDYKNYKNIFYILTSMVNFLFDSEQERIDFENERDFLKREYNNKKKNSVNLGELGFNGYIYTLIRLRIDRWKESEDFVKKRQKCNQRISRVFPIFRKLKQSKVRKIVLSEDLNSYLMLEKRVIELHTPEAILGSIVDETIDGVRVVGIYDFISREQSETLYKKSADILLSRKPVSYLFDENVYEEKDINKFLDDYLSKQRLIITAARSMNPDKRKSNIADTLVLNGGPILSKDGGKQEVIYEVNADKDISVSEPIVLTQ